jgi:small-conductance mechanosensitive channel
MTQTETHQEQELSPFLRQQAELMKARAQQDKDVAERTKYTLPAAVNETGQKVDPNKLVVVTDNLETGKTTHRAVALTPQPAQRFTRPTPFSLPEIREQLVDAGNTIDAAKEKYQADTASLDASYKERNALKEEIRQLLEKVNEKQAKLRDMESEGTPKDKFLAKIVKSEVDVVGIAGSLFATLSERAAERIFGIPLAELSADGQRDASGRYRKVFQRFTSGFYQRLGRTAKTATTEQVAKRADELLDDVSELIDYVGKTK